MLKSIFVSLYIMLLHSTLIYAIYLGFNQSFDIIVFGLIFCALPGVLVFDILLALKPVARTAKHLHVITMVMITGFVLLIYGMFQQATMSPITMVLSILCIIGWLFYDYWFSKFKHRDSEQLKKGRPLPNLQLQTIEGRKVETDQFKGRPCVYLFYRGNWCPLCMAQIQEIAALYQTITETGTRILLISPQPEKHTQKLASKFEVAFTFLVDKNHDAAKNLNIYAENGLPFGLQLFGYDSDTVLPTLIVTDPNGRILFADLTDNYRVRPEPQTIIDILAANSV